MSKLQPIRQYSLTNLQRSSDNDWKKTGQQAVQTVVDNIMKMFRYNGNIILERYNSMICTFPS